MFDLIKIILYLVSLGIFFLMTNNLVYVIIALIVIGLVEILQYIVAKENKEIIPKLRKLGKRIGLILSGLYILFIILLPWIFPNKPDVWKWGWQYFTIAIVVPLILIFSISISTIIGFLVVSIEDKEKINQKLTFLKISSAIFVFQLIQLTILFRIISDFGPFYSLWVLANPIIFLVGLILIIISFLKDKVEVKWRMAQVIILIMYILALMLSLFYLNFILHFT